MRKRIRWDTVLDVSDYQNVVNIVYVGLLGIEKEISEECEQQFHQSYKKQLLLYESYKKVEEVIAWQLEKYGIDALFILDSNVGEMYPKPEMSYIGQIEILVDKKDIPQVNKLMLEMDYEQREDPSSNGIIYVRVPGVRIVFYSEMPIENKAVRQYFSGSARRYRRMEPYRFIHMLTNEEEYLYRTARMVELYITGRLKIRDIIDIWQYKKLLGERFRWRAVREILDKAVWQEFADQIDILSELWFGKEPNADEQYGLALELEEYILSRGRENKHLDETLLPCEKVRLDFYWRNRDKEWTLRKQAWMFPPKEYMVQFFPVLEKYPFLLCFCWIIRNIRFLRRICKTKCKKAGVRIRIKLSNIKEKLKGMIRKGTNDEMPDEMPGVTAQAKEESSFQEESGIQKKSDTQEDTDIQERPGAQEDTDIQERSGAQEETEDREAAEDTANLKET